MVVVLPKGFDVDVPGGLGEEPKILPPCLGASDVACPKTSPEPPLVAGCPNENEDADVGGFDMILGVGDTVLREWYLLAPTLRTRRLDMIA